MGDHSGVSSAERDVTFLKEKAKRTLPISLFVLLGIIAMYLPLPRRFVAFLPLVIAAVLAVRLLQFMRGRPGREKAWTVVTLVLIGLIAGSLVVQAVFYPTVSAYERCIDGAQTSAARATCEELYDRGPIGLGLLG